MASREGRHKDIDKNCHKNDGKENASRTSSIKHVENVIEDGSANNTSRKDDNDIEDNLLIKEKLPLETGENFGANKSEKKKKKGSGTKRKTYSCRKIDCKKADCNEMVQCDHCDNWYHYTCVNVDRSIEDMPWACKDCQINVNRTEIISITSSRKRIQNELQLIEEEKRLEDIRIEEERNLKMRRLEEERLARENIERAYLAERKKNDEKFMNSKFELMSRSSSASNSTSNISRRRTEEWVKRNIDAMKNKIVNGNPQNKPIQAPKDNTVNKRRPAFTRSGIPRTSSPNHAFLPISTENNSYLNRHSQNRQINANTFTIPDTTMSTNHFVARQVLGRIDLPNFTGDPLDWPIFFSTFTQTTEQCCYTDTENLLRLQKSLKGEAYELVRSSLVYANSVSSIIQSLKQMYGQPETILNRLIQRIRSMPAIPADRFDKIIRFSIEAKNLYATIVASELSDHLNNPMLRQELVEKLPSNLKLDWGYYRKQKMSASLADFNEWLAGVADAVSLSTLEIKCDDVQTQSKESQAKQSKSAKKQKHEYRLAVHDSKSMNVNTQPNVVSGNLCAVCGSDKHEIEKCPQFLQLTPGKRIDKIMELRLCRTCLKFHNSYCTVHDRCGVDGCRRFHHVLLHKAKTSSIPDRMQTHANNKNVTSERTENQHNHHMQSQQMLYRIVPVYLYGPSKRINTFAMFDEGSTITLLEEDIAKDLQLDGPKSILKLKWTGDISRVEADSKIVSLEISGTEQGDNKYRMNKVSTVKKLELPQQLVNESSLSQYPHLQGITISSFEGRPKILIGLDQYKLGLPLEVREGNWSEPVATKTRLGWTICGPNKSNSRHCRMNVHSSDDMSLHAAVKDFFSLENFGVKSSESIDSIENERAKKIMSETTRYVNGRYETGLLWRFDNVMLPKSREVAVRRLHCFEKKLMKDPNLKATVNEMINNYLVKGYARKLHKNELGMTPSTWYLPLFVVCNSNKPSKVRLVWDAASKCKNVCLNDVLMKGPDEMASLFEVLIRFREKRVAISGDLKEMFHQIGVIESDRNSQRFLWRSCEVNREPDEYVMCVMTFGASCSPSIAQYIKNTHAEKYKGQFPRAVQAIQSNHYVDDWLDSFDTVDEAIRVANDVSTIHTSAGFQMRNWLSNDRNVLKALEKNDQQHVKI